MKKIILVLFIWIFSIFLVNKISANFLHDRTSYELPGNLTVPMRFTLVPFLNFDGRQYLDIATRGYYVNKLGQNLLAFFPLYPLLILALHTIFKINPVFAGLAISYICAIASVFLFYLLVKKDLGERTAFKSILLLIAFPTSFFLLSFYTESLLLLLSLLVFWFLSEKNLLKSSIFSGIATATRFFGLALIPSLLFTAYQNYKKTKKIPLSVLIAPLGFVGYYIYTSLRLGNFFAFISLYSAWDRKVSLFGPLNIFVGSFENVIKGILPSYDSPFVYPVIVIEFLSLIFITYLVVVSRKQIKDSYWLYLAASFFIMLFVSYPSSMPRYILPIFPIYIFLASKLNGVKYVLTVIFFILLQICLASLFLRGYWVS